MWVIVEKHVDDTGWTAYGRPQCICNNKKDATREAIKLLNSVEYSTKEYRNGDEIDFIPNTKNNYFFSWFAILKM